MSDRPADHPNAADEAVRSQVIDPVAHAVDHWAAEQHITLTGQQFRTLIGMLRQIGLVLVSVPGEGENPRVVLSDGTVRELVERPIQGINGPLTVWRISGTEQAT